MKKPILFILFLTVLVFLICGCEDDIKDISDTGSINTESVCEISDDLSKESESTADISESPDEESMVYADDMVREVRIEIYEEKTQKLITAFELTDQQICTEIFLTFDKCFAELCEKYPYDAAPDKDVITDYRVAVYLNTYYDTAKENLAYYIDISYPYGYTNDIYRLMHHGGSPFGDYVARCGKEFIDMVDEYAKQYIPK